MTAFFTAAGGDRRRLSMSASASGPAAAPRSFRRSPRVAAPPLPSPALPNSAQFGSGLSGSALSGFTESGSGASGQGRGAGRPRMTQLPPPPPPVQRDARGQTIVWTPDLVDWLYHCRENGFAVAQLARFLGCSTQTVFTRFHRDPRGVPGVEQGPEQTRITPREFARWGRGRAEDMPADVLAREVGRGRAFPPVGPLTRLSPRRPAGPALDLATDWWMWMEGEAG